MNTLILLQLKRPFSGPLRPTTINTYYCDVRARELLLLYFLSF
jgi:hypothetical protein